MCKYIKTMVGIMSFVISLCLQMLVIPPFPHHGPLTEIQDDPAASFVRRRIVHPKPDPSDSLTMIRSWFNNCGQSHDIDCWPHIGSKTGFLLPTRTLDFVPDGFEGVRLHANIDDQVAPYVALSHCWGKKKFRTTTSLPLDSHVQGLVLSSLSLTFTDAVKMTLFLGLRYLWIDAMCIIQDSEEGWETESAKMGEIYTKAFLTIAAAAAEDGSQGCFKERILIPSRKFSYVSPSGEAASTVHLQQTYIDDFDEIREPTGWLSRDSDDPHFPHEPAPLAKRAWCLQESILYP